MLGIVRVLSGSRGILKAIKDIDQPIRTQKAAEMRCYVLIQPWSGWHGSRIIRCDHGHEVRHWKMVIEVRAMLDFGLKGLHGCQEGLYHINQYYLETGSRVLGRTEYLGLMSGNSWSTKSVVHGNVEKTADVRLEWCK